MNETIGVKGGHNDYRRTLTITKKQKEKLKKYQLEREIKELEKEVKKKQAFTLIKTIPIIIAGNTIVELTRPKNKEEKKEENKDFIVSEEENKQIIIVLKDGTKQVIKVPKNIEISKEIIEVEKPKEVKINTESTIEEQVKEEKKEEVNKEVELKEEIKKTKKGIGEELPKEEIKEDKTISNDFNNLDDKQKSKLQKLQARKIIDVYENSLKDIRYDLRNLIIEYNTLVGEEEKIIKSKEEQELLDKLNQIIKKIEELKEKIKIDNLDKYDDNYIYTLIEGYLEEFKDKKIVKEIKDSPLYVLISSKLDEFDKKKDKFKTKVEKKKEEKFEKEEELLELKEKSSKLDKINKDLDDFYREQELLLREMKKKIDNAVKIEEKVDVQIKTMDKQTRKLLRRLSMLMFIPGPRGAKALASMTSIYADMAKRILNPETITKKYKVITVEDYSKDIENNINKIIEVSDNLSNTSRDIDKIISKIKVEYSEYIGVLPECDNILNNLEEIKSNIKEKEYELEKIKSEQEKELERNNAKVLSKGTYSM